MTQAPYNEMNRELVQLLCLEAGRLMEDTSADLALVLPVQGDLMEKRVGHLQRAALDILALANAASALVGDTVQGSEE
jgi:hypothetical protein